MKELTVVMPVYNEEGCIERVSAEWTSRLETMKIDYEILAIDDGSRDDTPAILDRMAARNARIRVVHQKNAGHGPSVLAGYCRAESEWIFQTDSDGESDPADFPAVWALRGDRDLVLGRRVGRASPPGRRLISYVARLSIRLLFGCPVADANCPYRLWRRSSLRRLLACVPADTFAPNVILSGLSHRAKLRVVETSVRYRPRTTGQVSILKWKLWKSAGKAFLQTLKAGFFASVDPA